MADSATYGLNLRNTWVTTLQIGLERTDVTVKNVVLAWIPVA